VLVSFGKEVGYGPTLTAALDDVLGVTGGDSIGEPIEPGGGPAVSGSVKALLEDAEAKFLEAEKALQRGDLQAYAAAQEEARVLVERALAAAGASAGPSASLSPSPSPSSSP